MTTKGSPACRRHAHQQPPAANRHTKNIFKHRPVHHGTGQKGARAAKRKYYLERRRESVVGRKVEIFFCAGEANPCGFLVRMPVTLGPVFECEEIE